jgi:hypothetical protein
VEPAQANSEWPGVPHRVCRHLKLRNGEKAYEAEKSNLAVHCRDPPGGNHGGLWRRQQQQRKLWNTGRTHRRRGDTEQRLGGDREQRPITLKNNSGSTFMSVDFRLSGKLSLAAFFSYSAAAVAAPPSTSPYYTDPQHSHVEDATSDGIRQVNNIICYMNAMKPDAFVNDGAYIALVDQNKCDSSSQSSASNAGSTSDSSQAATDYVSAVVNSTRASLNDPMLAGVWVDQSNDGGHGTIYVHLSATEAPTDTNPYGQFRLDFCGLMDANPSSCSMTGFMEGANGSLRFYQDEQRGQGEEDLTALALTSVGTTSGSGALSSSQTQNGTTVNTSFLFAYDQNFFLRGDQCFSRDASDPATGISVWSYGLYDATTGEHVDLNSGFPIQYTANGQTYQGFVGYWGLSLPQDVMSTISNGATVQKVDYGNNNGAPTLTNYTLVLAGGKLTEFTRHQTTLDKIDQIEINTWVNDATNFYSGAVSNTNYQLHWDEVSGQFVVDAQVNCGQNGCEPHNLDTPQAVSASFWSTQGLQGWSQALGGDVFVDLNGAGATVTSSQIQVAYHSQTVLGPDQMPTTPLYCLQNCMTATSLNAFFAPTSSPPPSSPYTSSTFNNWSPTSTYVTYNADAQNGVLTSTSDNQAAVFTMASAYQQAPQYQGGVNSGPLVDDLTTVQCPGDTSHYCGYVANNLDHYYMWQTGPNNWNQFAGLKDSSNQLVHFDPPMQVTYHVPNDSTMYGQYANKDIVLQYGGFGNLWGIPGTCVSSLTNQPVSCDAGNDVRFVAQFSIPDDLTNGTVSYAPPGSNNGSTTYLVKWLDREIRFANKPLSSCSGLSLPSNSDITLPTATDVKNPTDPTSDAYIGAKPDVTDAPRVIQGVVEY